jgi:hypothetical protein
VERQKERKRLTARLLTEEAEEKRSLGLVYFVWFGWLVWVSHHSQKTIHRHRWIHPFNLCGYFLPS